MHPFTEKTHALVDRYSEERGLPTFEEAYVGDAGAIVLASDVLIERGTPRWEACDADVLVATFATGGGRALAATIARAVLQFRRWLCENGLAGAAGLDGLECLANDAVDEPNGRVLASFPTPAEPPVNRSERRWRARIERRARRRSPRA
jgi:hypothetical protein